MVRMFLSYFITLTGMERIHLFERKSHGKDGAYSLYVLFILSVSSRDAKAETAERSLSVSYKSG